MTNINVVIIKIYNLYGQLRTLVKELDTLDKTNIYGDYKVCIKCKNHADVIEKGKNYCVECWFEHIEGKKFEDVKKEIEEEERFIKKK